MKLSDMKSGFDLDFVFPGCGSLGTFHSCPAGMGSPTHAPTQMIGGLAPDMSTCELNRIFQLILLAPSRAGFSGCP